MLAEIIKNEEKKIWRVRARKEKVELQRIVVVGEMMRIGSHTTKQKR